MIGFFFFQAEDGIRDYKVTGVQTCALPISACCRSTPAVKCRRSGGPWRPKYLNRDERAQYRSGRALSVEQLAERVWPDVGAVSRKFWRKHGRAKCGTSKS